MRSTTILFAGLLLAASLPAWGQNSGQLRYRWQDSHGLAHYSDSLSSDAIINGYDVVNDSGLVVQHVPRSLTTAERKTARTLAAQQAAEQRRVESRARDDQQLLSAYPDEASYLTLLQEGLNTVDQQISTTRNNLHTQEQALTDLLNRAADEERAKQPVPKTLGDSIAQQRSVVTGQRTLLQRLRQTRASTVKQNADDLAHYRQIKATQEQARSASD